MVAISQVYECLYFMYRVRFQVRIRILLTPINDKIMYSIIMALRLIQEYVCMYITFLHVDVDVQKDLLWRKYCWW